MDGTPRRVRSRAGTVAPSEPRGRGGDSPQRGLAAPDSAAAELPAAPALAAGDMVVSPYHAVGRVVERGVRTLFGAEREYLTVEIARGRVRLMVPVDQIGKGATLRRVSSPDELRSALEILATRPVPLAGTWQTRRRTCWTGSPPAILLRSPRSSATMPTPPRRSRWRQTTASSTVAYATSSRRNSRSVSA
jgi:hypothetical protein